MLGAGNSQLYDTLGLHRDAPISEVRKAYRRAAKKAHPDTGGSREKFSIVKTAYDVLSDPDRRKEYDETGKFGEKVVEDKARKAMELACATVEEVINAIGERNNPFSFDVIGDASRHLNEKKRQHEQQLLAFERIIKCRRGFSKRFSAKKGKENIISLMMDNTTRDREKQMDALRINIEVAEMAIAIINDHRFEVDGGPVGW